MLDPISRAAIVALSVLCVGATFVLAPIRARSSDTGPHVAPVSVAHEAQPPPVADLWIARDPFTGEPANRPIASKSASPAAPEASAPNDGILPLPGNLPASAIPTIPAEAGVISSASAIRITAIVTGAHPYAMVETGENHTIEGLGDRIAGQPITAIGIDGITLKSGQRLRVASEAATR